MPLGSHYPGYDIRLHTRDLWDRTDFENNLSSIGPNRNYFTDFYDAPIASSRAGTSDIVEQSNGWLLFCDRAAGSGADVITTPSLTSGGVRLTSGIDNSPIADESAIVQRVGNPFIFSQTAANARAIYMEFRFRVSSIANDLSSFFIGLAGNLWATQTAIATTSFFADDHTYATAVDAIGIARLDADGDRISFVYKAASQSVATVISDFIVPVADTWYKAGFVFDPDAPTTDRIRLYVNGALQSTKITSANMAAATFPLNIPMTPTLVQKFDGTTQVNVDVDWMHVHQKPE